jgi:hypothetical protein
MRAPRFGYWLPSGPFSWATPWRGVVQVWGLNEPLWLRLRCSACVSGFGSADDEPKATGSGRDAGESAPRAEGHGRDAEGPSLGDPVLSWPTS